MHLYKNQKGRRCIIFDWYIFGCLNVNQNGDNNILLKKNVENGGMVWQKSRFMKSKNIVKYMNTLYVEIFM